MKLNFFPDFKGHAVTTVTLKVHNLPWDTAYSDTTSQAYTQLTREIATLVSLSLVSPQCNESQLLRENNNLVHLMLRNLCEIINY